MLKGQSNDVEAVPFRMCLEKGITGAACCGVRVSGMVCKMCNRAHVIKDMAP